MSEREGEAQYGEQIAQMKKEGCPELGYMSGHTYLTDPKRLLFVLARYKFVSRIFHGLEHVLEVGCGDAFGTRIVAQSVGKLTALDFDPELLECAVRNNRAPFRCDFLKHDIMVEPCRGNFSGVFSLDVLEHVLPEQEDVFIDNIVRSADKNASFVFGSPSLESQQYASRASKLGHVNCKTEDELRNTLRKHFSNVLILGMNDEVVHTGFGKMAHYRFAVCSGPLAN